MSLKIPLSALGLFQITICIMTSDVYLNISIKPNTISKNERITRSAFCGKHHAQNIPNAIAGIT